MNDTDGANNLNTSRAARVAAWVTSHDSKHTKNNSERSKNRAELNSVAPGRRALADSAPFMARPEVRFVHNSDVHFGKLPCLRRETLGRLEAGAVTSCGPFDLQRSLDETDAIVTEQACSEVRNLVRMRRESELLASCRIQERRLRKRSP